MKIGVVGSGMVGGAAGRPHDRPHREDRWIAPRSRSWGRAQSAHPARVFAGDYEDLGRAGVVLICCGVAQRPGETRLQLLKRNAAIFAEVIPKVVSAAPDAVLVAASNPLDSARLRALVGEHLEVRPRATVHANVLGEHGDLEVIIWSSIRVGVFPLASFAEQVGRPVTDAVRQQIDEKVAACGRPQLSRWTSARLAADDHLQRGQPKTYCRDDA